MNVGSLRRSYNVIGFFKRFRIVMMGEIFLLKIISVHLSLTHLKTEINSNELMYITKRLGNRAAQRP